MLHLFGLFHHVLVLLVGLSCGAGCHFLWTCYQTKARRRIPKHWPVDSRRIVNPDEGEVWRFVVKTFPEHQVMVKLPFTRFTTPQGDKNKMELFEHLSNVYCTFTVSTRDGQNVGCVDVGSRNSKSISRSNQLLKLSLLSQCDICYWVVEHNARLHADELRSYFLDADLPRPDKQAARRPELTSAQVRLRGVVERQRQQRRTSVSRFERDGSEGSSSFGSFLDSEMDSGSWQTADSFIAPLETRPGTLQWPPHETRSSPGRMDSSAFSRRATSTCSARAAASHCVAAVLNSSLVRSHRPKRR